MLNRILNLALSTLLLGSVSARAGDPSDSGALDATFGSAGKVQFAATDAGQDTTANDIAIQPDGKTILVGYDTYVAGGNYETWRIARLNVDGSQDGSFNGGTFFINGNLSPTRAQSVALRPDGRVVVVGTITLGSYSVGVVYQFTAQGALDPNFNHGMAVVLYGTTTGDSISLSRAIVGGDGTIDVAGTYHDAGRNVNRFFFDRIAADGTSDEPFSYEFGSGNNQDDHALDLAIDNQGRYVLAGYHRAAAGNYDCAAIRIRNDLSDVDNGFGSGGQTTVAFDLGGDNGDFCNAVVVFPRSNFVALGGYSTATAGNGIYQAATLAMLDDSGKLFNTDCVNSCYPVKNVFAFDGNPSAGLSNAVTKLIIDNYNTKYPQLLAIGWGYQPGSPYGTMFGVARFNLPSVQGFETDTTFAGDGAEGIYFIAHPSGSGFFTTTNYGFSGAFANGKLVVAGSTQGTTTQSAITRLQAFDGIFKNGMDISSY